MYTNAVGLDADGRENLLPYGDMVFNGWSREASASKFI
jgi:hypothetical protein